MLDNDSEIIVDSGVTSFLFLVEDRSIESVLPQLLPEEQVFLHFLDSQLEMINNFYRGSCHVVIVEQVFVALEN